MSDLRDAALELAWGLCPLFVFATEEQEDEWKDHSAQHILAALQSAHAAGEAEGDRAGYERGVKDAAAKYKQLHDWIAEQISRAKYNADELGQGLKAWDDVADSMRNGIMASFADNVLALLPAQPKEPT